MRKVHILTISHEFRQILENNRVFMQKNGTFKDYNPGGKFLF